MIAHKSHSGQESTFKVSNEANVGIVERIDSVIQVSDTSFAVVWFPFNVRDTLELPHNGYTKGVVKATKFQDLKKIYLGAVFVGLEQESISSMNKQQQRKIKKEQKKKKNKGSILPFLYLFTGLLGVTVFCFLWRNEVKDPV